MRDLLRNSLRTSLAGLPPLDRLAAAWPVAAGHGIASRARVSGLQGGGLQDGSLENGGLKDDGQQGGKPQGRGAQGRTVVIEVNDAGWLAQLREMAPQLRGDLARISGVPLTDILFQEPQRLERTRSPRGPQTP